MRSRTLLILVAAGLALPGATASWAGKGSLEPDTNLDKNGGYMHLNPDVVKVGTPLAKNFVYFNAFQGQNTGVGGSTVNYNTAILATSHAQAPSWSPYAMLGVWKDCNHDGYVGLGDKGFFEYRTVLLNRTDICPNQGMPAAGSGRTVMPPHNDNTWVHEFLPIVWDANQPPASDDPNTPPIPPGGNFFNINDPNSRVWADQEKPGDPQRLICWISEHPPGTWHKAGPVVDMMDCYTGKNLNPMIWTATRTASQQGLWNNTVRAQQNPWGEPESDSYASVWDCSATGPVGPNVKVSSALNFTLRKPSTSPVVRQPTVSLGSPGSTPLVTTGGNGVGGKPASIGGTVNHTAAGANDCDREKESAAYDEWENAVAEGPYTTEGELANQYDNKLQTDHALYSVEGFRGGLSAFSVVGGRTTANEFGTATTTVDGFWTSRARQTTFNSVYTLGRDHVDPVRHYTLYAYVSPGAATNFNLKLNPTDKSGVYGSEACGATAGVKDSPAKNGWECDHTKWWPGESAKEFVTQWGVTYTVRVGQTYQLRDVDCYDESFEGARLNGPNGGKTGTGARENGIHIGRLSNSACA